MGILVNALLLRVLVDIENQEDISEEASLRLNELCKMLHELERLFTEGDEVRAELRGRKACTDMLAMNSHSRAWRCMCLCGSSSSFFPSCSRRPW